MGRAAERYRQQRAENQARAEAGMAAVKASANSGLGGFLSNIAGDVKDISVGLGSLIGHTVKDVGGEAISLVSKAPVIPDYEHSSSIDDLLKAMPGAIASDYKRRYGSGWDAFFQGLYEDPLSFVGDAMTVATAGGSVAAKAGLAKTGEVAALNPLSGRIATEALNVNPVRALGQRARFATRTEDIVGLEKELGALDDMIAHAVDGDPVTDWVARSRILKGYLDEAKAQGVTKMQKPSVASKEVEKLSRKITNESSASFVGNRDRLIHQHQEILSRLPKDALDGFHLRLQGIVPSEGARLNFDQIATLTPESFADEPRLVKAMEVLRPHIERIDSLTDPVEADAARRLVEIVGEPLSKTSDEIGEVIDDTRLLNFDKEATSFLDSGGTYTQLLDRLYGPIRVKEMVENGLGSLDEATPATKLDDLFRTNGIKAPAYYPHYSPLSARTSDFIQRKRIYGMERASRPKAFRQSRGRLMEGYLKDIKDAYETNPNDAYARLAAEVANYEENLRLAQRLKDNFGVKVGAKDEIPEGWVLINPGATRVAMRRHHDFRFNAARDIIENGSDEATAFIKGAQDLFVSKDQLKADLLELYGTKDEVFAVPQIVADQMTDAMRWSLPAKWDKRFRVYFDTPMNAWRRATLFLRLPFYMNNAAGNATMLGLQGGKLSHVIRQANEAYRSAVKDVIEQLGVTDAVEGGFWSPTMQRVTDMSKYSEISAGGVTDRLAKAGAKYQGSKFGNKNPVRKIIDKGQVLNSVMENSFRRESFLTAAEKSIAAKGIKLAGRSWIRNNERLRAILKYGIDNPEEVAKWVDGLNDTMNNYRGLGPFQRKVWRRFVSPFWPFYYHAAKTLLSLPYKHPAKARVLDLIGQANAEMQADVGEVPDWLEGAPVVGEGNTPGETRFFTTGGQNPFQGVMQSPFGVLGPVPQTAYEQVTGQDSFTQKPFSSPDIVRPFGSDQPYALVDGRAVPAERRMGGLLAPNAPGIVESLLGLVPYGSTIQDLTGGGARYSTGETIENQLTGEPLYPSDPVQELLGAIGYTTTDYNVSQFQERRRREELQATRELLQRLMP